MGFHKASNRYENGVAYVVADASWLSHLRKYALARHYLPSLAW